MTILNLVAPSLSPAPSLFIQEMELLGVGGWFFLAVDKHDNMSEYYGESPRPEKPVKRSIFHESIVKRRVGKRVEGHNLEQCSELLEQPPTSFKI